MFQDNISIEGHLQREALQSVREAMLLDNEAFGTAFLNSEDPGGKGDVLELHVMKKRPQLNTEHPVLRDSICGAQHGRSALFPPRV